MKFEQDRDYWCGFGLYIPPEADVADGGMIWQIHGSGSESYAWLALVLDTNRQLGLYSSGSRTRYRADGSELWSDQNWGERHSVVEKERLDATLSDKKYFETIPAQKLNSIVLKFRLSQEWVENVTLWINGTPYVYSGITAYNSPYQPYLQQGIYTGYEGGLLRTHVKEQFRIGNENATYADVAPSIP